MKRERDPTPEEFEKLLGWLDTDRDEAGRKLKQIQFRLIQAFSSRGCVDAESLSDEVLNRVAVRIDQVKKTYSDPVRCCLGFVDNVHREYLREQRKIVNTKEPPPPVSPQQLEREDVCLTRCLKELDEAECYLFVTYFQGEKRARIDRRKALAVELGLTGNALRIQAHRIRKKARQCMQKCLDSMNVETISG
jgi:hypothetical protein